MTEIERRSLRRARRNLLGLILALLALVSGGVAALSAGSDRFLDTVPLISTSTLRIALLAVVAGFIAYAIDRERRLRLLAERLDIESIERARMEARLTYLDALERERETVTAVVDASIDAIAVASPDLRLVRCNRAMEILAGVPRGGGLGSSALEILPLAIEDEPLSAAEHPLAVAFRTGRPHGPAEFRIALPDGSARWVRGTFSPICTESEDSPSLVSVILRDVTEAKRSEALLRDFVSIVSHELRAPLTAIKGYAKTLITRGDRVPEERREAYLATIDEQADRLSHLVDDLLLVQRIDTQRIAVKPEPVDPSTTVHRLVESFRWKWGAAAIEVESEGPDTLLFADPRRLEEILINLIDNAVKYSPQGAQVRVSIQRKGPEVEITVADRGMGIAADALGGLFEKFHRVATPETADIVGTGLGLYIVKGLVEAHGGRVWALSSVGVGSTFAFTLPAAAQTAASASGRA